jgi:hypothetical protein
VSSATAGLLAAAVAAALVAPARGHAQDRAQITATATIGIDPPALSPTSDLRFGTLRRGARVTVDARSSSSAARLEIRGTSAIEFSVDFVLPRSLETANGAHSLAIRFGPGSACEARRDDQAVCDPLDPSGAIPNRHTTPDGAYYIWLGGSVDPGQSPQPGDYTGTVTATVQYTGV